MGLQSPLSSPCKPYVFNDSKVVAVECAMQAQSISRRCLLVSHAAPSTRTPARMRGRSHAGPETGSLHSTFETLLLLESLYYFCSSFLLPWPCLQCPMSFLHLPFLPCFKCLHRTHTSLCDLTPTPLSSLILCQSLVFLCPRDSLPGLPHLGSPANTVAFPDPQSDSQFTLKFPFFKERVVELLEKLASVIYLPPSAPDSFKQFIYHYLFITFDVSLPIKL